MKKTNLISTTIITTAILGGAGLIALGVSNSADATEIENAPLLAVTNNLTGSVNNSVSTSGDETVYVIANANGSAKKTFVGNTLYEGSETLPLELKITYYLDGAEISASDLAGKSGRVKMKFDYTPVARYQGKYVPFLAISGTILDTEKFSNITVDHGKIVNENTSAVIVGYATPGLNANLGTDLLPDGFTIEADVKNFELGATYTLATSELFAELDTSDLSEIDNLINSMNELSNGLDQIITGSESLESGLASALDGVKQLYSGSQTLSAGLAELVSHNSELIAGAEQIANMAPTISSLISEKVESLKETLADLETKRDALEPYKTVEPYATQYAQVIAGIEQVTAGLTELSAGAEKLSSLSDFYTGLVDYADGVAAAATGAATLENGLGTLVAGSTELYAGSVQLKDGLTTLKTSGIDKLVNFANTDLDAFTRNLRQTVSAARSYTHFSNPSATSVKFIIKTASIK